MKYLLRIFLFYSFALWFVSQITPAITITGGWSVLFFAGFVLSVLMLFVAPMLKILFIPINLLTFGLLSWLINVAVLYLLTVFVPNVAIHPWSSSEVSWAGFVIPPLQWSYEVSLIFVSLAVSFIVNVLHEIS